MCYLRQYLLEIPNIYFTSFRGAKYCDRRVCVFVCLSICLSVCLSARISQEPHLQISPNFLYMLPVAVARSSSDDNAIRYVLPVLRITSCFHITERMQRRLEVGFLVISGRVYRNPGNVSSMFRHTCYALATDCRPTGIVSHVRRTIVSWSFCLCVCLLVTFVSHAKTAEPIAMPFGGLTLVGSRNHIIDRVKV